MPPDDLLVPDEHGLRCDAGGFYVDPWRPVDTAVVTHAHADHACPGCRRYIATPHTCEILRVRLGDSITTDPLPYLETRRLGGVDVSLHPAGHLLGSAQVRAQPVAGGPVWVVSGDYKTDPDPTCADFEPVPCDVFLTESTFGLPVFRWPDPAGVVAEINAWWRENAAAGRTSVLLTYALGKAQRALAGLDASVGPIGLHGAATALTEVYRAAGVNLPPASHVDDDTRAGIKGRGIVIAPPSTHQTPWMRKLVAPAGIRTAFVSGWMTIRGRRRWRPVDTGFVLSDHADFAQLGAAVRATGASRVGVTHGYAEPFARFLAEAEGVRTFVVPTRFRAEEDAEPRAQTAEAG